MRLPSLNALRAFEAAARHESFVRAADELCVTEGAVSRHVKLLEEELGVALFRRLARKVELTESGRRLLPVLTDAFESMASGARQIAAGKGDLRLICPPSFSIRWLIPRLDVFHARHPDVRVRLTTATYTTADFYAGDFDLGLCCYDDGTDGALEAVPVLPSMLTPVCAPQLLAGDRPLRTPRDLAAYTLLHTTLDRHDWLVWLKTFDVKTVDPRVGELFPTLDMAAKAATMGKGVVLGDLVLLGDELRDGVLVQPFPDLVLTSDAETYRLLGRKDCWDDPRIDAFKTWLLDAARMPR